MIHIKPAEARDAEDVLALLTEICDIHHRGRPDIFASSGAKYTAADLEKIFSDPASPSFVAYSGGKFQGYALCKIKTAVAGSHLCPAKVLYIDDLCVLSESRGAGIGSALIERLIAFARELKCDRVELNVWEFNEGARRLYERFGFVTQRRQLEYLL